MHLGLVDVLRCPRRHAPSALVASIDRTGAAGSVERGTLACPICDARYAIDQGAIIFAADQRERSRTQPAMRGPSADDVVRAEALLDLTEPGGVVLLGGLEGAVAEALRERADVSVVLYNPPAAIAGWDDVTPVYADTPPFAAGVLRGALLDAASGASAADFAAALRVRGRLSAPTTVPVPPGMRELARDATIWVAERVVDSTSPPVSLRRGLRA